MYPKTISPEKQKQLETHFASKRDPRKPMPINPPIKPDKETRCQVTENKSSKNDWIELPLDQIVFDEKFQVRTKDDEETVSEYAQRFCEYKENISGEDALPYPFDPIWAFKRNDEDTLVAGKHRFLGAKEALMETIRVFFFKGTEEEALIFAIQDNTRHGLQYSKGDRAICIKKALTVFPDASLSKLVWITGASRSYCSEVRTKFRNEEGFGTEQAAEESDSDGKKLKASTPKKSARTSAFVCWKALDGLETMDQFQKVLDMLDEFETRFEEQDRKIFREFVFEWSMKGTSVSQT